MERRSYAERSEKATHPLAKELLALMSRKESNLSVAADVTTSQELLTLAETLGPFIVILKTHIDILSDFDESLPGKLSALAKKHDFLIFEDRKFADIGATVKAQYAGGIYHIASWSHITNAHSLPGDGIVKGLKEAGQPLGRGLLLLAEMSSAGSLATNEYAQETLKMAIKHSDFVFGFIGQRRLSFSDSPTSSSDMPDFIYMTPGVQLATEGEPAVSSGKKTGGDSLGQQYRSPRDVIFHAQCDIIIVGRGILGAAAKEGYSESSEVLQDRARTYQKAGWDAYLERIQK